MSNELNVSEIMYGTLDPGVSFEIYTWNPNYNAHKKRASFFSVTPDPILPIGDGGTIEFAPDQIDLEITRVWNTVWVDDNFKTTIQWNVALANIGQSTSAFHLLQAETDN